MIIKNNLGEIVGGYLSKVSNGIKNISENQTCFEVITSDYWLEYERILKKICDTFDTLQVSEMTAEIINLKYQNIRNYIKENKDFKKTIKGVDDIIFKALLHILDNIVAIYGATLYNKIKRYDSEKSEEILYYEGEIFKYYSMISGFKNLSHQRMNISDIKSSISNTIQSFNNMTCNIDIPESNISLNYQEYIINLILQELYLNIKKYGSDGAINITLSDPSFLKRYFTLNIEVNNIITAGNHHFSSNKGVGFIEQLCKGLGAEYHIEKNGNMYSSKLTIPITSDINTDVKSLEKHRTDCVENILEEFIDTFESINISQGVNISDENLTTLQIHIDIMDKKMIDFKQNRKEKFEDRLLFQVYMHTYKNIIANVKSAISAIKGLKKETHEKIVSLHNTYIIKDIEHLIRLKNKSKQYVIEDYKQATTLSSLISIINVSHGFSLKQENLQEQENIFLHCHPEILNVIAVELYNNIIKYGENGNVTIKVTDESLIIKYNNTIKSIANESVYSTKQGISQIKALCNLIGATYDSSISESIYTTTIKIPLI